MRQRYRRRCSVSSDSSCLGLRLRRFGLWPSELVERQEWHDATAGSAGVKDDRLIGSEQPLHGLEIDALACDLRRLLVLVVDLEEAGCLTARFGNGLLLVGFGRLQDLGSAAARLRDHPVGVGLR